MRETAKLKLTITLPFLTLYGLGTIIGAGIFVLMGKVAGIAGVYAPVSFLIASIIAAFSAFSYAELSSRFPKSAGEAIYLEETFHRHWLSTGTGIAVTAIGIISAATISNGAVGYIQIFIDLPSWQIIILLVAALALLAAWGISESVSVAVFSTMISIAGLILVIIFNSYNLATLPERLPELIPDRLEIWGAIVFGAFIAFYAFIGFEDMINVAEEVKEPQHNMPMAIILALIISTLLYVLISLTAILTIDPAKLAASTAPLAVLIGEEQSWIKTMVGIISIFAITDGILIQIIKTSRMLYGMSKQSLIPPLFAMVHPYTRTPLIATAAVAITVLILALSFPLLTLAQFTSFITLVVFAAINFTLWRLKMQKNSVQPAGINLPVWVPMTGFFLCMLFILAQLLHV